MTAPDAPPAPKPKRPRKSRTPDWDVDGSTLEPYRADDRIKARVKAVQAAKVVQIPAETDPASAFRADMQLRKTTAQRHLDAIDARIHQVDADRHDRKTRIDAEANAILTNLEAERRSTLLALAGAEAALIASEPPGPVGAADVATMALEQLSATGDNTGGGYIGLTRDPATAGELFRDVAATVTFPEKGTDQ